MSDRPAEAQAALDAVRRGLKEPEQHGDGLDPIRHQNWRMHMPAQAEIVFRAALAALENLDARLKALEGKVT